ncbi:MAG: Serine hydroxymethyltransferase [Candidatus Uhrbacteria bacterium GW2011_GWA2_52_8d]|uniref:Serine hydroxymethyltransferase n=1 Tax=Candidatus Uhrbacteria bacterium GW2011_GWA2_52_8d TaxID=1618979 RepID=A0A0G1XQ31_9BACT|nr:MAG: Serine hydroxymethyltransferase [Candidatus Uhrbacteria bacterium GW2011_GWA2_52_8d]
MSISTFDPDLALALNAELKREQSGLEMIPSENFVSEEVLEALGSIGTNKYSEGYPGMRYYGGNEWVDVIENLARDRAKQLFGVTHANVQPASGCAANIAVMFALLNPGDTLMGMNLFYGGHMTHGLPVNFSGRYYHSVQYTSTKDGWLDFDEMHDLALQHKPKLIIVGATAYPRLIDWQKAREVADAVGAFLMADIAHVAGLVVSGDHPSPVGIADVITTTTHKTLRGPRGAMILANGSPSKPLKPADVTKENIPTLVDRAIIPGIQGGPHNHQTAAIAVALKEALQPDFKEYGHQIVKNAKALAAELMTRGFDLVTGGTDNHLMVVDLTNKKVSGKQASLALDRAGITVNKNTVPFEPRSPFDPSGIRLGTPALTTRGMKEEDMKQIAAWIDEVISHHTDDHQLESIKEQIKILTDQFLLYPSLTY